MSVTYTDETNDRALNSDAPYVPAYARSRQSRKSKGGIKTWMILAPIGVLAVGGVGAVMLMNGEPAPMVEAEATTPAPIVSQPLSNDVATAPLTSAATPAPVEVAQAPAPAPVARAASPEREAAPVRRAAPRVAAPVTPRVEEAPVLTGPQPYSAAPSTTTSSPTSTPTSTLNRAPVAVTPAPTPATPAAPAPVIVVQPAG